MAFLICQYKWNLVIEKAQRHLWVVFKISRGIEMFCLIRLQKLPLQCLCCSGISCQSCKSEKRRLSRVRSIVLTAFTGTAYISTYIQLQLCQTAPTILANTIRAICLLESSQNIPDINTPVLHCLLFTITLSFATRLTILCNVFK